MPHDDDHLGSQHGGSIFQAADNFGSNEVARNSGNEDLADVLIEYQFDRNSRIGTRKDPRKRLLLAFGLPADRNQVLLLRGGLSSDESLVSFHQSGESRLSGNSRLRVSSGWRGESYSPGQHTSRGRP